MNSNKATVGWAKYVVPVVLAAIITVGGGVYFNYFYFVPQLTYQKFQPYKSSENEQIVMIVIANEGQRVATNIRVKIESVGELRDYQFESAETVTPTREGKNILLLNCGRLVQGTQITVFITTTTSERDPIGKISIVSDQVAGQEKKLAQEPVPLWSVGGGAFVTFFLTYGYMQKRVETLQSRLEEMEEQLKRARYDFPRPRPNKIMVQPSD